MVLVAKLALPSTYGEALSLAVGLLEVVLAWVAMRNLFRFGRRFPWLVLLGVFFAARGLDRVYVAFSDIENPTVSLATDALLVVVMTLLIGRLDVTVRGLRAAEDEADWRRDEYERALSDYRSLVRHRLANPLTVLRGGIETLARRGPELASETREQVVAALREELDRLETTTLEPYPRSAEERVLMPTPHPRSGKSGEPAGAEGLEPPTYGFGDRRSTS